MKEPINDWEELQSQWQSYQPDIKRITKKINWVTWRMIGVLAIDVALIIGYPFFLYYEIAPQNNKWIVDIWFYLMGVLTLYGVYLDFKLRIPIIRLKGDSTKDILQLYLERTKVGVQLGSICKLFCIFLLVLFWVWVAAIQYYFPEEPKYSEWNFIIFGSLWISLFIPIANWYQNKKQNEYDELSKLWGEHIE